MLSVVPSKLALICWTAALKSSYIFLTSFLTEMAHNVSLNDFFDWNNKRWTQSFPFMDVFAKHALTFPGFVRPVAKCIIKNLKEQSHVIDWERKPLKSPFPFRKYRRYHLSHYMIGMIGTTASTRQPNHLRRISSRRTPKSGTNVKIWRKSRNRWAALWNCPEHPLLRIRTCTCQNCQRWNERWRRIIRCNGTQPFRTTCSTENYALAVDYRTYRFENHSLRYDKTDSTYIAKIVKKVKSQMKAHLCNPKDRIYLIGFLATLKHACDTNRNYEGAAVWVLPDYVLGTLTNAPA